MTITAKIAAGAATFALAEDDLLALIKDPSRAKDLYMHGNLRVESGDAREVHHCAILLGGTRLRSSSKERLWSTRSASTMR